LLRRVCAESGRGAWGAPKDAVLASLRETGGAVFLCSLTTAIGYASLCASANLAINSFGIAMVISEVTCVLVALVMLPALLVLVASRKSATATKGEAS